MDSASSVQPGVTVSVAFEDFEHAKENIQPLKRGRNPLQLKKSVELAEGPSKERADHLSRKRAKHEEAITAYTGDDPLMPWLNYIAWTQQSYTTGAKAHLQELLEKCTQTFKDDARYKHNERYVKVWIMYADTLAIPDDVFSFLKMNGIGQQLALTHMAWAMALEHRQQFAQAATVITRAIQMKAEPIGRLKDFKKGMEQRAVKRIEKRVREHQDDLSLVPEDDAMQTTRAQPLAIGQRRVLGTIDERRRPIRANVDENGATLTQTQSTRPRASLAARMRGPGAAPVSAAAPIPVARTSNVAVKVFVEEEFDGEQNTTTGTASTSRPTLAPAVVSAVGAAFPSISSLAKVTASERPSKPAEMQAPTDTVAAAVAIAESQQEVKEEAEEEVKTVAPVPSAATRQVAKPLLGSLGRPKAKLSGAAASGRPSISAKLKSKAKGKTGGVAVWNDFGTQEQRNKENKSKVETFSSTGPLSTSTSGRSSSGSRRPGRPAGSSSRPKPAFQVYEDE